jgi:protein-tyrosine-phosphatase
VLEQNPSGDINPLAIEVMREFGMDIGKQKSKGSQKT